MNRQWNKYLILASATVCVLVIGSCLKDPSKLTALFDSAQNIREAAVKIIFGAVDYDHGKTATAVGLVEKITGWVENTLLPGEPYIENKEGDTQWTMTEYYPSKSQLDAMIEENKKFLEEKNETAAAQEETTAKTQPPAVQETQLAQGSDQEIIPAVATPANGIIYPMESLMDYNFLINNFYIVDSSTASDASLIDGETLLGRDLTIDLKGDDPKILIYHTHSQEKFADSVPGDVNDTVVGLGTTLTNILEEKYKISVYHDTSVYDMVDGVEDRNEAYSLSLAAVEKILAENPSIKVVIDLHRDGVGEDTRLVTNINGKPTAKIMFFNGLCRNSANETNGYLQNPYLTDNLAFSLQMQLDAAAYYPGFTRKIYLKGLRYNEHLRPKSSLIEVGAQTNTYQEALNAMEPLSELLHMVLSGK